MLNTKVLLVRHFIGGLEILMCFVLQLLDVVLADCYRHIILLPYLTHYSYLHAIYFGKFFLFVVFLCISL